MPIRVDISEIPLLRDAYLRGEKQGEVTLLRRLLEGRFGPLPEWAVQKLQTASDVDLERWAVRVLQAASLEDALSA